MQYLQRKYTSPEGIIDHEGEKVYSGDMLEPYREHIQANLIHGFDFDVTMLRIAAMNLLLHGIDAPDIHYQDTLSGSFSDRFPKQAQNFFDIILANPPFKGSLDFEMFTHPFGPGEDQEDGNPIRPSSSNAQERGYPTIAQMCAFVLPRPMALRQMLVVNQLKAVSPAV
jgi:hypothetical protein